MTLALFQIAPAGDVLGTSGAVLSDCGTYRYVLWRRLSPGLRSLLFVMLNPSTADETEDDPTIRKCMHIARRDGFDSVRVVNLFAYRATDPKDLIAAMPLRLGDNIAHVIREVRDAARVICAWGANVDHKALREPAQRVIDAFQGLASDGLWCLGKTMTGAPKHPLYLPNDVEVVPWP